MCSSLLLENKKLCSSIRLSPIQQVFPSEWLSDKWEHNGAKIWGRKEYMKGNEIISWEASCRPVVIKHGAPPIDLWSRLLPTIEGFKSGPYKSTRFGSLSSLARAAMTRLSTRLCAGSNRRLESLPTRKEWWKSQVCLDCEKETQSSQSVGSQLRRLPPCQLRGCKNPRKFYS